MNEQLHSGGRKFSTGPDQLTSNSLTVKVKGTSNVEMWISCKSVFPNTSTWKQQERNKTKNRNVKRDE